MVCSEFYYIDSKMYLDGLEHRGDEGGRQLEILGRPLGEADDLRVGICAPGAAQQESEANGEVKQEREGGGRGESTAVPRGFHVKASLYRWPSTSMSTRIGTRLSLVGLQSTAAARGERISHHHHHLLANRSRTLPTEERIASSERRKESGKEGERERTCGS